jgi:hypothetical protein
VSLDTLYRKLSVGHQGTEEADVRENDRHTGGTPTWVKVFVIVALVVVVLVVVLVLTGRGDHGPGRHSGPPPGLEHGQP